MEALILSRFDPLYGPKIFFKAPKVLDDQKIKDIPLLMELNSKGVFIHIFEDIKTANLLFKLPSGQARGRKETLLISIITDINSELKLNLAREILESFSKELINLNDAYRAFNIPDKNIEGDTNKLKEIENLFFSVFKSIKRGIKTLEMAENRFQALFKAARDATLIINRDLGIIVDANEEAEKLFELKREEMIGQQFSQLEIFTQDGIKQNILNYSSSEDIKPAIKRLKKSNDQTIFVKLNTIEIELGDLHLLQLTFHDITDIKLAEKQVKTHAKNIAILNKIIILANQAEDISKLLNNVLENLIEFLNFDGCCIYLIDKLTNKAKIESNKGLPPDYIKNYEFLEINQNPYDIIFEKGVCAFNNDFPELERKILNGTIFTSIAFIPLFSKVDIIGAILMLSKNNRPYSPQDKELLISIGLQLGIAIDKIKNEENLRHSETRNKFLLNNIPFSIFRMSKEGLILDVKLSKVLMKNVIPEDFIGKNIRELIPSFAAKDIIHQIEESIILKKIQNIKLILQIKNKPTIFQAFIDSIGDNEVLIFLQNVTRSW